MQKFAEYIQRSDFSLEQAALLMAQEIAYPFLDVRGTLSRISELGRASAERLQPDDSKRVWAECLNEYLFEDLGFQGNNSDYYDPRNSFLNDVLIRHTGIPITLSVLYMAVARQVGLPVYGVGLPGHFVVGCRDVGSDRPFYIDVFNKGKILSETDCEAIARQSLPKSEPFSPEYLLPQSRHAILTRMLMNLHEIYVMQDDAKRLLCVLMLQQALMPDNVELYRDVGVLSSQLDSWGRAVKSLRYYLYRRPNAGDRDAVQTLLNDAIERWSQLN
jgi:regulator of sirC expression with transglutaminase-like and TPR domain